MASDMGRRARRLHPRAIVYEGGARVYMYMLRAMSTSDRAVCRWMQGILFASMVALVGCGASSPSQAHEGTKNAGSSTHASKGALAGELCGNNVHCSLGLVCQSPEDSAWNSCGAPSVPHCEPGFTGDACGNCFRLCNATTPCPDGTTCNGSTCQHPSRCVPPQEPVP